MSWIVQTRIRLKHKSWFLFGIRRPASACSEIGLRRRSLWLIELFVFLNVQLENEPWNGNQVCQNYNETSYLAWYGQNGVCSRILNVWWPISNGHCPFSTSVIALLLSITPVLTLLFPDTDVIKSEAGLMKVCFLHAADVWYRWGAKFDLTKIRSQEAYDCLCNPGALFCHSRSSSIRPLTLHNYLLPQKKGVQLEIWQLSNSYPPTSHTF